MSRVLPILFNTDMVRAILDGRKTVTRRVIKPQMDVCPSCMHMNVDYIYDQNAQNIYCARCGEPLQEKKPPYHPGDILYVRETWGISNFDYDEEVVYIVYKASENEKDEGCRAVKFPDNKFEKFYDSMSENSPEWRPSIHMSKEAARIWLKVTDVRVERLQDMTLDDFLSEGVVIRPEAFNDPENAYMQARSEFVGIWNDTIKKQDIGIYDWNANPYVFVIEFEQCEKPEVS